MQIRVYQFAPIDFFLKITTLSKNRSGQTGRLGFASGKGVGVIDIDMWHGQWHGIVDWVPCHWHVMTRHPYGCSLWHVTCRCQLSILTWHVNLTYVDYRHRDRRPLFCQLTSTWDMSIVTCQVTEHSLDSFCDMSMSIDMGHVIIMIIMINHDFSWNWHVPCQIPLRPRIPWHVMDITMMSHGHVDVKSDQRKVSLTWTCHVDMTPLRGHSWHRHGTWHVKKWAPVSRERIDICRFWHVMSILHELTCNIMSFFIEARGWGHFMTCLNVRLAKYAHFLTFRHVKLDQKWSKNDPRKIEMMKLRALTYFYQNLLN